ncbi:thyrotropin-releasing hormone receptor-like [Pomacea canaliculata]|uniref:thyrotropin-releasing hormone receptor-like n=1 Tax=Pomacea canaliculata TaxID=400727 RepID=UPI000D736624|nr:thyrotropin-releasing hormone receptor-like [Pomacea canaliculata]
MNRSLHNTSNDFYAIKEFLPWNNPSNIISYDAYYKMAYYFNNILKPLVLVIAIPTSIISGLVFKSQGLKERMNLCLLVLTLVDMTFVCYSMVFTMTFWIRILMPVLGEEVYTKAQYYAMNVNYGLRETSACISGLIAVERCVCVVLPFHAHFLMSTRTMGILLVAMVITMQLAFITTPLKRYVFAVYDNTTDTLRWTVAVSDAWHRSEGLMLYDKAEDTFMLILLPLVIFFVVSGSTVITVVKLRSALSWRDVVSSSKDSVSQQVALTRILVLVSGVFIASKAPWVVITLVRFFYPDFSPTGTQSNIYRASDLIAHYCLYFHSSINFFIYYSRSSKFRLHLSRLCQCSHSPPVLPDNVVEDCTKTKLKMKPWVGGLNPSLNPPYSE